MAIVVILFTHLSNSYAANSCEQETIKSVAENKMKFINIEGESFDDNYVKVANIKREVKEASYSRTSLKTFDEFTNSEYEDDASVSELSKKVEFVDDGHEMSIGLERKGSFIAAEIEFENDDFKITQNILIDLESCRKQVQDTEVLYSPNDDEDQSILHVKQWKKVGSNLASQAEKSMSYKGMEHPQIMGFDLGIKDLEVTTSELKPKCQYDPFLKDVVPFNGTEILIDVKELLSYTVKQYGSTKSDYSFSDTNGNVGEEINEELFLLSRLVGDDGEVNEVIGINENNIRDESANYSIETPYELELDAFTTYSSLKKTDKVNDDGWPIYQFDGKTPNLSQSIEDVHPSEQRISDFDKKYLNISTAMKTNSEVFNNIVERISSKKHETVRDLVQDALDEVDRLLVYDHQMAQGNITTLSVDDILKSKKGVCQHYTLLASAVLRKLGVPTRQIGGLAFDSDGSFGHAWIEVKLDNDTYVPFEPQTASVVTSGYIPMADYFYYEDTKKHKYHSGKLLSGMNALGKIRVIRN